ncbi:MAG: pyridoxal-phosphate dependent enzyme [Kordiimonadaceae bacterium]|jgi:1-aminocyclopropane-1-carboxylate deaminase|nr:pyridoxal-phosphate dependent enzyme [Kordiimonadaceae bacterium]MBT6330323.1 pyridoxal-phosphate dependent enzyme [Kordiimonadaceae bacterium]
MPSNISRLIKEKLSQWPTADLAQLPTAIHPLKNFGKLLDGQDLWIKRDDLTGLEGGGNKTRKLDYLVGDALAKGADMLVTVGAIQSNHTRQTAAAAAKNNMKCALLHYGWTKDAGPNYRKVGNIFLSSMMGADLYIDETVRPIEDQGPLAEFVEYLKSQGHRPYLIDGGASFHELGTLGYLGCAQEIVEQCDGRGIHFDYVVQCTGSSSTQAGLVAGFKAMGEETRVIGISDDEETTIKSERVLKLANNVLQLTGIPGKVTPNDIEIIAADKSHYGERDEGTMDAIRLAMHRNHCDGP